MRGRRTFANMLKYIKMTASSNFGNVFSVLVASAFLPFLPMLPLHLLIQNLLYDVSQVAIPFDNVDDEQIQKPQRWNPADLGRFMIFFGPISSIFDILTFCLMWWVFHANTPGNANAVPVGLVCGGLTVANADCAYDPHPSCTVYSELCIVAVNDHDRDRDDCRESHCRFHRWPVICSCRRCR
ncbi:Mg(2+) transport ATPase, P-type [Escherichia coli]|uniref:Mg(2+) transport ATPase, P-type n=1 Tax=Escherichia coli TaxID=562 RepID=A0A377DF71_ECOLX|nr:Mg(2+) transport ATPase, P-type [Escherichia coli]